MAIESKMSRGPIGRPLGQPEEKKKNVNVWIWVIVILAILIGGFIWWYKTQTAPGPGSGATMSEPIKEGEYHAVFLDNGQVYFGKLKTGGGDFFQLTDVFYLQAGTGQLDQGTNLSLTKLGNEAHGPQDKMEINKEHVLFYEAMKSESKVAQAIQAYKTKKP
ncbi:MAG: hypothetical protein AAB431_00540 [Patescibacteria group bacterium]